MHKVDAALTRRLTTFRHPPQETETTNYLDSVDSEETAKTERLTTIHLYLMLQKFTTTHNTMMVHGSWQEWTTQFSLVHQEIEYFFRHGFRIRPIPILK